jgi:hypothetical protein
MATRHRIPTIFNLSMVDVLCCALGCVILLWLINLREAKQRAVAATTASSELGRARDQLDETGRRLRAAEAERDRLGRQLAGARGRVAALDMDLAALRAEQRATADRLAKKTKEQTDLARDLAAARQRVAALDVLVRDKEAQVRAAAHTATDLEAHLHDADARLKALQAQADRIPGLREEAQQYRDRLAESAGRVRALEAEADERARDLAGAGRQIAALQDERRSLADQANRARAAAENRFAGITLSGRRVVFLVDMSGSMELVDENTAAPEKWKAVRQTVARVMRSLPDLEKFQVLLFSARVLYPLGNSDRWLDFDPVTSTSRVAEALALVKPEGSTDMSAAFEAAFRFRPAGLDTIYLLSDGLPNVGEGLSPQQAATLKETERNEILSTYIRRALRVRWNAPGQGRPRVRINAIGFFYESPDVGAFLWALARENDGSFVGMSKP